MEILQIPYGYNVDLVNGLATDHLLGISLFTAGAIIYWILPIGIALVKRIQKNIAIQKNKVALRDMVLMKDIQNEMDIEIREALIREELRSKKG